MRHKNIIILFVTIFLVAGVSFLFLSRKDESPLQFTTQLWKQGDQRLRGRMVDNLIESRLLDGKTEDEVLELIGKPDGRINTDLEYTVDIGQKFGGWFGGAAWTYNLRIRFENSKVTKVDLLD